MDYNIIYGALYIYLRVLGTLIYMCVVCLKSFFNPWVGFWIQRFKIYRRKTSPVRWFYSTIAPARNMSHTTVAATAVEDAQTEDNTQVVMKNRPQSQCLLDIRPEFVFGLTIGLSGNCLFLNDHTIVYPATGVIVVYEMEMHSQKFVKLKAPRRTITAMDLSSIKYALYFYILNGAGMCIGL